MALEGCIGAVPSLRTRAAIMRVWAFDTATKSSSKLMNDAWLLKRIAGCPSCGLSRKFSVGYCRRCLRIRWNIRDSGNGNALAIIPYLIAQERRRTLERMGVAQRLAYLQAEKLRDLALSMNC